MRNRPICYLVSVALRIPNTSIYPFLDLVSPNSIKVTPVIPGGPVATVNWEFNGRDTELMQFQVELDGMVVADVCPSDRDAKISGLLPSTTHSIKVIALFKDQQQTECQTDYTNSGMLYQTIGRWSI